MSYVVSAVVLAMLIGAFAFAGLRFLGIWALIKSGREEELYDDPKERAGQVLSMVFGHKKVLDDRASGAMHMWFLYGFLILGIGHGELVLNGLTYFVRELGVTPFLYQNFLPEPLVHAYHLSQDVLAMGVIAVSFLALGRRWSGRIRRLQPRSTDAEIILWFIAGLYLTFFIFVPSGFARSGDAAGFAWWAPFSSLLATHVYSALPADGLAVVYWIGFWSHLTVFLGFACYLPMSKHMHLVWAGPNIYFHKRDPVGVPQPIDFETAEKYGVDRVTELSWKTLLDTFACTECGRCNAVCPAHLTGKPLKPKKVLHDLKVNLKEKNGEEIAKFRDRLGRPLKGKEEEALTHELPAPLLMRDEVPKEETDNDGRYLSEEGQIHLDTIWACTTCAACVDACPVLIDSVPGALTAMRQNLVMMEADFPPEMTTAFKGMENQANPWGVGQDKREDWAEGLGVKTFAQIEAEEEGREVDYLFWVGCASSTDDRAKRTQKALVKVLKRSGVDFAILGCEESCTGDPARRMGNEYVWDMLARTNVEVLNSKKFKKIFTTCPHCFNALGNEYQQVGGEYEVLHHSDLLSQLMRDKRIPLDTKKALEEHVTFHDPCYLGRYNGKYDQPREVLKGLPGVTVTEMEMHKRTSFCCGAGGGRMFMEEHIGTRVNVERTDQALKVLDGGGGAKTIAVGCPFCMTMMTDGTKAKDIEDDVKVKDIAELLAERLEDEGAKDEEPAQESTPATA